MECLSGFASSIARDLVCRGVDELRYPCCFNSMVEELEKEEEKFVATRTSVNQRINDAKKQTRKPDELVQRWLKEADTGINNVEEVLTMARRNKRCCFGHCPNWIWRYRVGRRLAETKRKIEKSNEEGSKYTCTQTERLCSLPGLGYFSSERCLKFESRQSADEQLMKALKDDDVHMIGLYGMGGCGKTTLAIEVGRRAKEEDLFDEVVFVAVSGHVEVQMIQEKIASWLSCKLEEKEEMLRAQRLYKRLIQEDKILVILDDVWQRLDFVAIGIPSRKEHKGCKVLITTRTEEVCILMDCQKRISLALLTEEEAWDLFKLKAEISEATSISIKNLAKQISDECEGLPVAITPVACTLRAKQGEEEWRVALSKLKRSKQINIANGFENPYTCLRLSYDYLDSDEAKSLFLFCSVFPEDYAIPVEILIRFAVGLGLVGEVYSYEGARIEVSAAKTKLISSWLLLDAGEGTCVKMHDFVQIVALWIAADEKKKIKCALEKDVTVKDTSLKYLWCEEFPYPLAYSNLEFLCLNTYMEISNEIFEGMEKLRVLFLLNKDLKRRPLLTKSFKSLLNLRCLHLEHWELADISYLGNLKKIESLTMRKCSFFELLDVVVTHMTNLRLLDLLECDMERNPFELIGRHPQLEELYIAECKPKSDLLYGESYAEFFSKFSVPHTLQRYQIQIGSLFQGYQAKFVKSCRTLFLSCFDTSNAAIKDLAKKAEVLCVANIQGGAKNITPDIFQIDEDMNDLFGLLICDSADIEHLFDTGNHLSVLGPFFSKLRMLRIEGMEHLRSLYRGQPPTGLFEKLEELYIEKCPQLHSTLFVWKLNLCSLTVLELYGCLKLTSLFPPMVAQSLVQLENFKILYCAGLKHIIADDNREEITTDDYRLVFPKLKQLTARGCSKLEYILPVTFTQGLLQLECLEIDHGAELKYVFGQCKRGGQLANRRQNELKIELPLLAKITLANLPNIIGICPENCYPEWPSLCQFTLQNCPEVAFMTFNTYMAGSDEKHIHHSTKETPSIKEVRAIKNHELAGTFQLAGLAIDQEQDPLTECLQKLHSTCNGLVQYLNLQNLEQMEVSECREFSAHSPEELLWEEFKIENFSQLNQTIGDEEHQNFLNLCLGSNQLKDFTEIPSIPTASLVDYNSGPINLCNLKRLILRSCSMLRTLFSPSTAKGLISLEELMVVECHSLKYLVTCDRAHENQEEIVHDSQKYISIFPKLERISVSNCNLLEYIFHVSYAHGFVGLKDIEIRQTPQLKYVFGQNMHDDDVYSSPQHQSKIEIELPVLEEISFFGIPNMINICPDNYYTTCSALPRVVMDNVGLFTLSINNLMLYSGSTRWKDMGGSMLGTVAIWNSPKIKGFSHLEELPINGQQGASRLINLNLVNLPSLNYIWKDGAKHLVTLQHINLLHICGCPKLKAVFFSTVSRSLPQLKILVVLQCEGLEQIIEDDEKHETDSNTTQPSKVCFSKLKLLLVTHCNNLKRIFYLSTSYMFPELEYLIINQDPLLEEVFELEQGVKERREEVLFPELKHVVLMQLPNLKNVSQWIDLQTLTNLLVHNCPKLSLTSTTTAENMLLNYYHDREVDFFVRCDLLYIRDIMQSEEVEKEATPETTSQHVSNQSMLHNLAGSVNDHKQIASRAIESHKVLSSARKNKGHKFHLTCRRVMKKQRRLFIEKVPELPTFGSEQRRASTSLPTSIHKRPSPSADNILKESCEEDSTSEDAMKSEAAMSTGTEINVLGVMVVSVTQTGHSDGNMLAEHSQIVVNQREGETETSPCLNLLSVDSIQKGSSLMDKEAGIGGVSNDADSIDIPPAFTDTRKIHSLIVAELGEYQRNVGLDDAQIALLAEAIAMYPHLWDRDACKKFSTRYQAWMMKTLADMLLFLRNENVVSVTPERVEEFHRHCNELVQFGFERSWVDQMRQRVMARDPELEQAQARLSELLKRHEQLSQQLRMMKSEINNLNDHIASKSKCFDFL